MPLVRAALRPEPFEFPVYTYIVEHADGHIAIDTGLNSKVKIPRFIRRILPHPLTGPDEEIGPQMRKIGLSPDDVRLVLATHLDWDHVGGVGHFPNAEIQVHRPEWDFASKFLGKVRYIPKLWPESFRPKLYDLDPEPLGPFPTSRSVTDRGDVRLVPIPGHSIAQVGVVITTSGPTLFFGADHMLSADLFASDIADERLVMLGALYRKDAIQTSRRIAQFIRDEPTILLPAHDADAARNLAAREPLKV